jgi:hypothetical protein
MLWVISMPSSGSVIISPFSLVNRLLRKSEVQQIIDTVYRYCGQKESVIFCDQIMTMGFKEAFKAGISFGKDDMLVPETKWPIVDGGRQRRAPRLAYWLVQDSSLSLAESSSRRTVFLSRVP